MKRTTRVITAVFIILVIFTSALTVTARANLDMELIGETGERSAHINGKRMASRAVSGELSVYDVSEAPPGTPENPIAEPA